MKKSSFSLCCALALSCIFLQIDRMLANESVPLPAKIVGAEKKSGKSLDQEWTEEYDYLKEELKKVSEGKLNIERLTREALRPESVYSEKEKTPSDVVYRRTFALIDYLRKQNPKNTDLTRLSAALLEWKTEQLNVDENNRDSALNGFKKLCQIRRKAVFMNPLLNFDRMLFMTRYNQRNGGRGEVHMVDQYLGFNQGKGGSVYVLENMFSDDPTAKPLCENIPVNSGKMKGNALKDGSFLSLELSYDAKKIYFAWTQAEHSIPDEKADWSKQNWNFNEVRRRPQGYHHYYWGEDRVFHIYSADLEKGEISQLTEGIYNDYDPCELPDGRIAFISERIGGNQRCGGRWLATATLHSMKQDGSDLFPISYHETNEWGPSVSNDGMLLFTRWDYVDRDNGGGHHLWTCYPDGRDPRSHHANYSVIREHRPNAEMMTRAIPNSRKYISTATAHHGLAYGSLIMIDTSIPDDKLMSQVKRITPEALFPEAEKMPGYPHHNGSCDNSVRSEYYGTPWPLSEDFYLSVYARNNKDHGIYVVDSFGNKELLWFDKDIPCVDPIPLRPRHKPPIIPTMTKQSVDQLGGKAPDKEGEVVVINVYDTELPLPPNTKVKWIRVVNIFPKTNAYINEPYVGYATEALTRGSLGLIPVEEDGSAYFKMPVATGVYFQLLDENKQAVHSMKSSAFVHPGERLSCLGCHEDKQKTPENLGNRVVKALKRKPSEFVAEPKGAYPLSFPRLVQPVLDKNCVACHEKEEKAPPLDGRTVRMVKNKEGVEEQQNVPNGWSNGFMSLHPLGWGKHGGVGTHYKINKTSYSVPGEVGAQASRLLPMLLKGHHDVKLSSDDLYRITLWMDLNTNFYGDYHQTKEQAEGKLVWPKLGVPEALPAYIKNQDPN